MRAAVATQRCPHCHVVVELPGAEAGDTVMCPAPLCRRKFTVTNDDVGSPLINSSAPQSATARVSDDQIDESEGSPVSDQNSDEAELECYQSPMFRRYPFRFLGSMLLIFGGLAGVAYGLNESMPLLAILGGALAAITAIVMLRWWWKTTGCKVILREKSLVVHGASIMSGGVDVDEGSSDQVHVIHYGAIREIHIYQPWLDRMLKAGSIVIDIGEKDDICIDSISRPQTLVKHIRELGDK